MDALVDLRQRLKGDSALPPGTKLTFLPFFIKASVTFFVLCLDDGAVAAVAGVLPSLASSTTSASPPPPRLAPTSPHPPAPNRRLRRWHCASTQW